jgi:ADP-heptose:LPS heptosyltransferase
MSAHIVLIRFSSLGDVLLQTSVVSWLRHKLGPSTKITFVTSEEFKNLVSPHPWISKVFCLNRKGGFKALWKLRNDLRVLHKSEPIDLVFDLHGSTRSWILRSLLFLPSLVVHKRRLSRWLLVKMPWAKKLWLSFIDQRPHVIRLEEEWCGFFPKVAWKPETFLPHGEAVKLPRSPYIVFSPVASFAPKRYPLAQFREILNLVLNDPELSSFEIVVVGGPQDQYCEELNIPNSRVHYLQGKLNLYQTTTLLKSATLCVGNDSGINHMAEALNVKVLTLFGPTHEAFGFAPFLPESETLSVDLPCRPCSTTGVKPCHQAEQWCFTKTTPPIVHSKICQMVKT